MSVLSGDFAAVDVREELCYHSLTEKAQIQEVHGTGIKPMKESHARRQKRQPIPKRVSGDGSAPPRLSVWFSGHFSVCFSVACAWLRRAQRAALVYAKHTPRCQIVFLLFQSSKTIFCNLLFARINSCIFVEKRV